MSTARDFAPQPAKKSGVMGLLADWRAAAAVLAAVILILTPVGARRSLSSAVDKVEEQFYTGVQGRGGIAKYLADCDDAATGLTAVGSHYDAAKNETDALRTARVMLADILDSSGASIADAYAANEAFVSAFTHLKNALLSLELSEQDASDFEYYSKRFENAQGAVPRSGYNEAAEDFTRDVYDRFPAKIIGSVLGVEPPQSFQ